MTGTPELLLARACCGQCLTTTNRIVPAGRAAQIMRDCRAAGHHFRCHKGDLAGKIVHCRGVHDLYGSKAHSIAIAIGVPVVEVDADALADRHDG